MMTEIRHNFTKDNSLSAQITTLLRDIFAVHYDPETLLFHKKKWADKPWYSSTYEGRVHNLTFRVSRNESYESYDFAQKIIDPAPIRQALEAHEFIMRKSFVASAKIKNIEQKPSYIDLEIEAVIIFEE